MEQEKRITLARRVSLVSGIFCGVVALLLILNFWQMKQHEPLESATIEALMKRLADEPNNEELKAEIRSFDLLARKAYFTSRWQVKTGTWLLLIGGVVLAVSLKIYTDLRARIEQPEQVTEELLLARANAQYWLMLAGGLILGLSLVAAYLSNDYLAMYRSMNKVKENPVRHDVEVIDVFPAGKLTEGADSTGTGTEADREQAVAALPETGPTTGLSTGPAIETVTGTISGEEGATRETLAGSAPGVTEETLAEQKEAAFPVPFNRDDFKKNQASFRGYMGLGVSYHKNIPVSWNGATGEHIKWKIVFSKPGFNSPVIWGDKLFISGGDDRARIVACYNRHTGQLLWEQEVKGIPGSPATMPSVSDDTGLAAPTMTVDGNRVYAIFATGDIVAFDLEGHMVWGRNLGVPNNHYGHASSLMIWENKLVVQYDTNTKGRMLALESSTGETLWDVERPVHISWSSPILIEVDGRIQIVTTADPYVSGHDLESGEERWKIEAMMGEVGPSAAFLDGIVYATQEYARTVAIKPGPGAAFVWEDDMYMSEASSPVAHNGLLFLATSYGVLVCYDAKTGDIVWEKEFDDGFYSSPMIAEERLYVMDRGGVMHILKADRSGTLLAEPAMGEPGDALPVFADGNLYLRGRKHLFCIGN